MLVNLNLLLVEILHPQNSKLNHEIPKKYLSESSDWYLLIFNFNLEPPFSNKKINYSRNFSYNRY